MQNGDTEKIVITIY